MRARFLLLGTLAAAVAVFAWQSVSNAALPWHTATLRTFPSDSAIVQAVRAAAPENGVWVSHRGIVAAVSLRPDLADRRAELGPMLARQLGIDLVAALLLALVVLRLPVRRPRETAVTLGLAALAVGTIAHLSDWNWYGFAAGYEVVNLVDLALQGALAGVVLGALRGRLQRAADATASAALPVHAEGGLPTAGIRAPSRAR